MVGNGLGEEQTINSRLYHSRLLILYHNRLLISYSKQSTDIVPEEHAFVDIGSGLGKLVVVAAALTGPSSPGESAAGREFFRIRLEGKLRRPG